ncbi:MAG: ferrochelatase [Thermodesulfobacteriota bacterium]|nr:ferrochelatase [Thermodesulfobacteriota bacterium]
MMKALFLLAFGGPRSLEEVEFLLTCLFGRKPSPELLERVKERYRLIGGCSPLPTITERQARALEEKLNSRGYLFKSYVGMRYSQPLVEETLKEILQDGVKEVVAIPMAPFRSRFSTGAYKEELNRANKISGEKLKITFIEGWHSHPLFLQAVAERVVEGLKQFTPEESRRVHLIFTAHSLPESVIGNDPYVHDMKESVDEVVKRIEPLSWHMAFQSKGGGPGKWIAPDVESILVEINKIGVREVLIVPIGFVSDHIEVLYDIDILYKEKAESLGMILKRTPSLNFSERFIEALASIVEDHIKGSKDTRVQGA